MLDDHPGLPEALGAGGGDVVEADHVQHGRAHEARHGGRLEQAEHHHRHDGLPHLFDHPAEAGRLDVGGVDERQPVQRDRKQQDEQQAGEEGRQRKADEGERVGDLVEDRIGPRRGIDADRDRDQRAPAVAPSRSHRASSAGAAGSACRRSSG